MKTILPLSSKQKGIGMKMNEQMCERCPILPGSACSIPMDGTYDENGCCFCGNKELANCGYECKVMFCESCGHWLFPEVVNQDE